MKDKLKKFFESDNMAINYNKSNTIIIKKNLYDSKYKMIYMNSKLDYKDEDSMYNDLPFSYVCTIDDKGNIVHMEPHNCKLLEIELEEDKCKSPKEIIANEIKNDILNYFENEFNDIKRKVFTEFELLNYTYEPELPNFIDRNINKKYLYKFLTGKDELIKEEKENIIKNKKDEFRKYFEMKRKYELLQEKRKDPLFIRKEKLIDIQQYFFNKNNIRIYYTDLNNKETFITTLMYIGTSPKDIENNIISKNKVDKIPIKAITKIVKMREHSTWFEEEVLYDTKDLPELKYDFEEKEKDFLNNHLFDSLSEHLYGNKEFMKKLINKNYLYAEHLTDVLKKDSDFMLELFKENNSIIYYMEIIPDINFGINFLKMPSKINDEYIDFREKLFINMPKEFYTLDNIKKYYKYLNDDEKNNVLLHLPDEVLNSDECLRFLKNENCVVNTLKELQDRITNIDVLLAWGGVDNALSHITDKQAEDKKYVNYLLDNVTETFKFNDYSRNLLLEKYKDDFNIIKKMINYEPYYDEFLDRWYEYRDKEATIDEIYEMASININFLKFLDIDQQLIYLKDEFAGFERIKTSNNKFSTHIIFKTSYGELVLSYNILNNDNVISFFDNKKRIYELKPIIFKDKISKIIINEFNDRYPDFKGCNLKDIVDYLNNITKEKER